MISRLKKNLLLAVILLISAWLNITGLIPNTFFHQNEPGLLGPSDQLFKNIITNGNFDPNIKPDPFKYASILYYIQAFIRGGTLFFIYEANKFTGFSFGSPDKTFSVTFTEFVLDNGPQYFEHPILWTARFFTSLLGIGCVYLIYLISIELFKNRTIALFSAAALAVMPLHVRNSHYALADIPQVLFFLLSFLASIKMYRKQSTRSYLLAGFLVGFSSAFKYFPLSLFPFLIFHSLTGWRNLFSKNFLSALIAVFFGYWLGMPYLFVHFNEIAGFIPYALTWYGPDKLEAQNSIFERLLPHNLHAYHLKFLFAQGMLPLPFLASLAGIALGLKYFKKATLLSLIIPLANGIFIFFYVHQIYEQLPLPMLPFLAIYIGIASYFFIKFTSPKIIAAALVILILYLPSLFSSAKASLACSTPIPEYESRDWIRNNIPLKSNFAFQPGARLPSDLDINWVKSEVTGYFSLSELQEAKAKYLLTMNGYYGVFLSWSYDELFPPKNIINNQYVQLVINEYNDSAMLIKNFVKPYMCISNEIYIYQIPKALTPVSKPRKIYNFESVNPENEFKIVNINSETSLSITKGKGLKESNSLNYTYHQLKYDSWREDYHFYYTTPAKSDFIPAEENQKYTLEGKIRNETSHETRIKDFFLRIDFYTAEDSPPVKTSLSPRAKLQDGWQSLQVTSLAPSGTKLITIGFQALGAEKEAGFLIDDIILYEK